jgi:hypothetical protein
MPVSISIPEDAEPGGLYGSVLVSTYPVKEKKETEASEAKGGTVIISRVGTLFFVRVPGDAKEEGLLKSFSVNNGKKIFTSGPFNFELLFENNGNVYLAPYGIIEIKNIFHTKISEIQIDPWFAMPDSVRFREIKWDKKFMFGRYSAEAKINRGYDDIIDEATVTFWVIPWKVILAGFAGIVLILLLLRWVIKWLKTNFEIKKKTKNAK